MRGGGAIVYGMEGWVLGLRVVVGVGLRCVEAVVLFVIGNGVRLSRGTGVLEDFGQLWIVKASTVRYLGQKKGRPSEMNMQL
jgi:hypothetical protein